MNATRREGSTSSAQERHGLYRYGAFRAARIAAVDPIFESGSRPQARIAGH
jgi:hypothetical protein